jgi:SAM-dependent methyltransferase
MIEHRLGLRPGATLLDVGCGLGLQVMELSARGYLGVGLDLSLPMLSRASEEAQMRALRVNFLHSDMREMSFDGAFDAVLCLGTSLGYFDDDTNRRIVERLHRALKPGGQLLLDLVNRDYVIRSQPNLIWFEGDGCVCMEESEFNFFTSRLHVKRTVILDSGRQTENEYSLRLYSLHELGQLLNGIGFRVKDVSGRDALPGVFFGQESPSLLIVAERRLNDNE